MNTIEIKDEEINVEEIMRQIRENIRKRKESGAYTQEMEALINEPLHAPCETKNAGQDDLQQNLNYINSSLDAHKAEALLYLMSLEDKSLDGLFSVQKDIVVEV